MHKRGYATLSLPSLRWRGSAVSALAHLLASCSIWGCDDTGILDTELGPEQLPLALQGFKSCLLANLHSCIQPDLFVHAFHIWSHQPTLISILKLQHASPNLLHHRKSCRVLLNGWHSPLCAFPRTLGATKVLWFRQSAKTLLHLTDTPQEGQK